MDNRFRIVFRGALRPGVDPLTARQQTAIRLKASPAQLNRVFSGERVILKQHLDATRVEIYQRALEQLGLIISIEDMDALPEPDLAPSPELLAPKQPAQSPSSAERDTTDYSHFERTHINLARAEALLNGYLQHEAPLSIPPETPPSVSPSGDPTPETCAADVSALPVSAETPAPTPTISTLDAAAPDTIESVPPSAEELAPNPADPSPIPTALAARLAIHAPADAHTDETLAATVIPLNFSQRIRCSHCGTEHQLEGLLQINLTPMPRQERDAG
ncbi:MAG: hypothetical protein H6R19_1899 [Proteobacteria bacterium]|nr:hypothetical protein [Pseudomonadota bacterium]